MTPSRWSWLVVSLIAEGPVQWWLNFDCSETKLELGKHGGIKNCANYKCLSLTSRHMPCSNGGTTSHPAGRVFGNWIRRIRSSGGYWTRDLWLGRQAIWKIFGWRCEHWRLNMYSTNTNNAKTTNHCGAGRAKLNHSYQLIWVEIKTACNLPARIKSVHRYTYIRIHPFWFLIIQII